MFEINVTAHGKDIAFTIEKVARAGRNASK